MFVAHGMSSLFSQNSCDKVNVACVLCCMPLVYDDAVMHGQVTSPRPRSDIYIKIYTKKNDKIDVKMHSLETSRIVTKPLCFSLYLHLTLRMLRDF